MLALVVRRGPGSKASQRGHSFCTCNYGNKGGEYSADSRHDRGWADRHVCSLESRQGRSISVKDSLFTGSDLPGFRGGIYQERGCESFAEVHERLARRTKDFDHTAHSFE